jgi:hypothetical protein
MNFSLAKNQGTTVSPAEAEPICPDPIRRQLEHQLPELFQIYLYIWEAKANAAGFSYV